MRKIYGVLLFVSAAMAEPQVSYMYPAGAQVGSHVLLDIGGNKLMNQKMEVLTEKLQISGPSPLAWSLNSLRMEKFLPQPIRNKVWFDLTVPTNAVPGRYEIRVLDGRMNASRPNVFFVGELPEQLELEKAKAGFKGPKKVRLVNNDVLGRAEPIAQFPSVINGKIGVGGDVDYYSFEAEAGETYIFDVQARRLIPFIADGVPGWFQAVMAIVDKKGHELAYCDDHRFEPDPKIKFTASESATYFLKLYDSIYRGRDDFIYRIYATKGSVPQIDLDAAPITEREPNQGFAQAQRVSLPPALVKGVIGADEDQDFYCFDGMKGEDLVIEVRARANGSPLDSALALFDAEHKLIARNDDHNTDPSGLTTHDADSSLRLTLPETGTYFIYVSSAQHKGGATYNYQLMIRKPQPDFELQVTPSALRWHKGGAVKFQVKVCRKDGFNEDIHLKMLGFPDGVRMNPKIILSTTNDVTVSVKPPAGSPEKVNPSLVGSAGDLSHEALVGDRWMQAFIYWHFVPVENWVWIKGERWQPRKKKSVKKKAKPAKPNNALEK